MARRLAAVPQHALRGVVYVRVSALMGREGEAFRSPSLQAGAVRQVFDQRGIEVVEVVEDLDSTGRTFTRHGLDHVLALARAGRVDVVGCYDLSRLGRNVRGTLGLIEELREVGVKVVSTVEQVDDTPEGQFMLGQFLGMAQLYSDQVGRRWRQVHAQRHSQGRSHGGPPPFGYRRGEGGLVVEEAEAEVVREAFTRYAAGESPSSIARDMDRRGVRAAMTVPNRVFDRVVYSGRVVLNGQVAPGGHEAIVGEDLWQRVQQRRALERGTRRLGDPEHSLGGLLRCAGCGYVLTFDAKRTVRHQPCYKCANGRTAVGCAGVGAPNADAVQTAVLEMVRERLVLLAARSNSYVPPDLERLQRQERRASEALAALAVQSAKGLLVGGREAYEAAAATLVAERDAARTVLARSRAGAALSPSSARTLLARIDRTWRRASQADRNAMLGKVLVSMTVSRQPGQRATERLPYRGLLEPLWVE